MEYAQQKQWVIQESIDAEVSSGRDIKERKIDKLRSKLQKRDILLVAELGRLGKNMLETLNVINELGESGINIIFARQPELSTAGPHTNLLLAIYSYFAEAERVYISMRTKQGWLLQKLKVNSWDDFNNLIYPKKSR